jgi:competence protein ComEC
LVLRLRFGERSVLFTGDAEAIQEAELVERYGSSLSADLLKVGHHGSRTSTAAAFLAAVDPSLAFVSSGVRNRFGHPHPLVLERLARAEVPLIRTDRAGAVRWLTDGFRIDVYVATLSR